MAENETRHEAEEREKEKEYTISTAIAGGLMVSKLANKNSLVKQPSKNPKADKISHQL